MKSTLIYDAKIINEGVIKPGHVIVESPYIKEIIFDNLPEGYINNFNIIDAKGLYLLPGVIDDQVHFREPGLTHKADIYTESKAAVAGGVTSFMDMPNTNPQTITIDLLEQKFEIAAKNSFANYSFYLGATNDNIKEIKKIDPANVCGLKVFMGSSTGNMLVDDIHALEKIFAESPVLITTHCEDENTIKRNTFNYKEKYGEDIPVIYHPEIRNAEACYLSSSLAVKLAKKYGSRLHILHISSARELELFENKPFNQDKKITSEVCIHHLWFEKNDYINKGTLIKWNPAIKNATDRKALRNAISTELIDVIATDHAPHTLEEKNNSYFKAPSGGPMVQHSLTAMIELSLKNIIGLPEVVKKMCHNPADLFNIEKRGYIRKGYFADLVLADLNLPWKVSKENILYKCKWSPLEGETFRAKILKTFINGHLVFDDGKINESIRGMKLSFQR